MNTHVTTYVSLITFFVALNTIMKHIVESIHSTITNNKMPFLNYPVWPQMGRRTAQRVLPALSRFCPKTQPIFAITLALGLAFALVLALALALAIAIVFPLLFPCVPCVYSPTWNSPTWNSHPH